MAVCRAICLVAQTQPADTNRRGKTFRSFLAIRNCLIFGIVSNHVSRKDSRPFASLLPGAQDHGEGTGVQEEETTHTLSSGTGLRVHPRGIESASGISPLPPGEKATYRQTLARHAFHGFSSLTGR